MNTSLDISLANVGLLKHPLTPRAGHLERGININGCGGLNNNESRIGSNTILEFRRPNSTTKASLRVEDCTTFINTSLAISLANVGLLTGAKMALAINLIKLFPFLPS